MSERVIPPSKRRLAQARQLGVSPNCGIVARLISSSAVVLALFVVGGALLGLFEQSVAFIPRVLRREQSTELSVYAMEVVSALTRSVVSFALSAGLLCLAATLMGALLLRVASGAAVLWPWSRMKHLREAGLSHVARGRARDRLLAAVLILLAQMVLVLTLTVTFFSEAQVWLGSELNSATQMLQSPRDLHSSRIYGWFLGVLAMAALVCGGAGVALYLVDRIGVRRSLFMTFREAQDERRQTERSPEAQREQKRRRVETS